jgi:superoxide reductase
MKNEVKFYRCKHCGNIIAFLEASGVGVVCCGEDMEELHPNTTDAAAEKHVPVGMRSGDKLTVKVGSVPHPMTAEHHIAWIAIAEADRVSVVHLSVTGAPEAEFTVGNGPITMYAYCNLHGLWTADIV